MDKIRDYNPLDYILPTQNPKSPFEKDNKEKQKGNGLEMVEDLDFGGGDNVNSERETQLNLKLKNAIMFKILNNRKFNSKNSAGLLLREAVNNRKEEKIEIKQKL